MSNLTVQVSSSLQLTSNCRTEKTLNSFLNCKFSILSNVSSFHFSTSFIMLNWRTYFPSISPHFTVCHDLPSLNFWLPRSPSHHRQHLFAWLSLMKHVLNLPTHVISHAKNENIGEFGVKTHKFCTRDFLVARQCKILTVALQESLKIKFCAFWPLIQL